MEPIHEPQQTDEDFIVTIETVRGKVNYNKLIERFGSEKISQSLVDRIERLTGKPAHPFLKRQLFFSHRDLNSLLDEYEKGRKFYLYTGRGPSSESMHLGHLVPFMFCKYLQDAFDAPLVIQITEDEKFLYKKISLEQCREYTIENVKDIIACGFDVSKTFIFSNMDYIRHLYPNVIKIQKSVTVNQVRAIFGIDDSSNIGKVTFNSIQAAPSFSSSFSQLFGNRELLCLIPCGIDQDPYFLMTRDVASKINYPKPALIHSKFTPSLHGLDEKMSSSIPNSAIFLTDTEEEIRNKIMHHAFSGGRVSLSEHRQFGADLTKDVPYHLLMFFMQDENLEFDDITERYRSGQMLTTEIKNLAIKTLLEIVKNHREAKSQVTEDIVKAFMSIRKLDI